MLCKNCHYPLKQLSEPRCPECGLAFDPNDPSTFDIGQPHWLFGSWIYWSLLLLLLLLSPFIMVFVAFWRIRNSPFW